MVKGRNKGKANTQGPGVEVNDRKEVDSRKMGRSGSESGGGKGKKKKRSGTIR